MGNFHRFVDPTYYLFPGETFPAVPGGVGVVGTNAYDRVNVVSGGAGAGGSANADAQVAAGTNQYTYFVAFGNDGTSLNTNRGFRAAFENLDVIDDVLRTSLPKRASQAAASPGANNVVVTGEVFVSEDPTTPATDLFYVVATATGRPIYNGTTRVVVTDVDTGVPGTIIGTGWATNPTVRFNTTVSVAYTLYYGTRTSYGRVAETEPSAWWTQYVSAARIAAAGEGTALHGLDERYRRATNITSATAAANTPGDGATITRDGKALTFALPSNDLDAVAYPDPWLAAVRTEFGSYASATQGTNYGADLGLLALSGTRNTANAGELSSLGVMRAAAATYVPRNIAAASLGGAGTSLTRIPAGAPALLNVGGTDPDMITLTAPSYFRSGFESAVHPDADILLVDFGGGDVRSYLFTLTGTALATQAYLKLPTGLAAPAFAANTPVTVTWYSAYLLMGGTQDYALTYAQPRPLGSTTNTEDYTVRGFRFLSHNSGPAIDPDNTAMMVFDSYLYGGYDTPIRTMEVYGNGNILTKFNSAGYETDLTQGGWGRVQHAFQHRTGIAAAVHNDTIFVSPDGSGTAPNTAGIGFGALSIGCTGVAAAAFTLNLTSYVGSPVGTTCELFLENYGDGVGGLDITLTWDSSFIFSDPADGQFGAANLVQGAVVRYRLTAMLTMSSSGPKWFVERLADYYL